MRPQNFNAVWFALVTALVVVIYWVGLGGAFFFDDGPSILFAPGLKLQNLSAESLRQAWFSGGAGPSGRPIAQMSFALNYYFSGFNPFAFKATNLAIHLGCGAFVFLLARRLLVTAPAHTRQPTSHHAQLAASAVAVWWLLHPLQLLPVLHVVQRMTSLSAFFVFFASLLHIKGREKYGIAGAAILSLAWFVVWPLSVLSKETGLLFPAFALAWELVLRRHSVGKLDRFACVFLSTAGLLLVGTIGYLLSPAAEWLWTGYGMRSFTLAERLLTEGRVIWMYLGLIFVPSNAALGLYHDDIVVSTSLFFPWTTAMSLVGLASVVWLAWQARLRAPLVTFGIAWFLIGHLLESTALPLELAHEHRNYVPLFGIALAAGSLLLRAMENPGGRKGVGVSLAVVAGILFAVTTALRAHQFGNELLRTQMEAQHHPASARAQHEAGAVLADLPDATQANSPIHSAARHHYEQASSADPNFKISLLGLIGLNCKSGVPVSRADVNELSRRLFETPFAPGDRNVLYTLKEMAISNKACLGRADIDAIFSSAIANHTVSAGVKAMLKSWHADYLWLAAHDLVAARQALGASLTLNPGNASNRLKWAQLLIISGQNSEARLLLLALRDQSFSADERDTLNELLAKVNIAGP